MERPDPGIVTHYYAFYVELPSGGAVFKRDGKLYYKGASGTETEIAEDTD